MKTLQITGSDYDENLETTLWLDKSARDVLRDRYGDTCIIREVAQPKSLSHSVVRPKTFSVEDRDGMERSEVGESIGTLVELD
jgi:hypothetical protein